MVKKATPKKAVKAAAPAKDAGGRPARDEDSLRSDRLVMRVHPDFMKVLSERAAEQRLSRSRFIEEVLRGVLALDPRNPRFDVHGKIDPRAPTAAQRQMSNPLHYLQQIAANSSLQAGLFPQPGGWVQPRGWEPTEDEK
jgi:hypothetical protein